MIYLPSKQCSANSGKQHNFFSRSDYEFCSTTELLENPLAIAGVGINKISHFFLPRKKIVMEDFHWYNYLGILEFNTSSL